MIFNLNEQKVLSDPSGSSVFKGEKDFNDIVVNLPDNIDGHTATELNYVMHFVDSDGGYSTKILTVDSSGKTLKATATVSTSITSKAQAFYAYVLMTDDEETVIGKTNGVIVMIHPVPDEENEIIPPADADKIIKGLEEIVQEATETIETATDTIEEATEAIRSKQDKLTAGENITISDNNVISAEGGLSDYTDLENKPSINNVTLSGNKSSDDLSLQGKLTAGNNITINNGVISASGVTSYNDLTDKPQIRHGDSYSSQYTDLNGDISFGDGIYISKSSNRFTFRVDKNVVFTTARALNIDLNSELRYGPIIKSAKKRNITNLPSFVNAMADTDITLIQFAGEAINPVLQFLIWFDESYEPHYAQRACIDTSYGYYGGIWQEIGSGSQIVSGVVNANGTITFTDSDGNTFTTTGSSVIGFSPVATVTQTASGATVSITDSTGTTTANIANGSDYVLTQADKAEIAQMAVDLLPNADSVDY